MDPDEFSEEQDQQGFVEELLRRDALEQPALGIAKLFVDKGRRGMSEKQQYVLDTHILDAHRVKECDLCSESIPWSEQAAALDNGGICGYCEHKWNKVMDE